MNEVISQASQHLIGYNTTEFFCLIYSNWGIGVFYFLLAFGWFSMVSLEEIRLLFFVSVIW
jgi:hypothetical protein